MERSLARRTLARAAARLNARSAFAGRLPPLILMTDDDRLRDPLAAAAALPRGSLAIVRARDASARAVLAAAMTAVARTRGHFVLIAGDPKLAVQSGADGLHLPETSAREAIHWRACHPHWLITVAAHSLTAVANAGRSGADAALLSPVFVTQSHTDRRPLTAVRANAIARQARIPIYALGGIDGTNASRIAGEHYAGIAAIGALAV